MNGETNIVPVDRFTMAHLGIGMWLGALKVRESTAIGIAIGWEIGENVLKDKFPQIFPDSRKDILSNAVIDALAMYAGYKITKILFKVKTS